MWSPTHRWSSLPTTPHERDTGRSAPLLAPFAYGIGRATTPHQEQWMEVVELAPQSIDVYAEGQPPGAKFMRTLWLCHAAGGPVQYTGKELGGAHAHPHITSDP